MGLRDASEDARTSGFQYSCYNECCNESVHTDLMPILLNSPESSNWVPGLRLRKWLVCGSVCFRPEMAVIELRQPNQPG